MARNKNINALIADNAKALQKENIELKERIQELENLVKESDSLPCVSEMFYIMVDDKKILSIHKTEKGAIDRKKEWHESQFDGVFTMHKLEVED